MKYAKKQRVAWGQRMSKARAEAREVKQWEQDKGIDDMIAYQVNVLNKKLTPILEEHNLPYYPMG